MMPSLAWTSPLWQYHVDQSPPHFHPASNKFLHLTLSKSISMTWSTQKQRTTVIYNENSQIIRIIEDAKTKCHG